MKNSRHSGTQGILKRILVSSFSILLILTLICPAWAVVFTNSSTITINDAVAIGTGNPYPSNIAVSGMSGNVTNVTMRINNLNHTFPDDFDMLLVAPNGNNLIVWSDVGGSDDLYFRNITLDDAAANSLPDATVLSDGSFKPTNIGTGDTFPAPAPAPSANTTFATAFNGIAANGTWSLYVVDDLGVDMGVIGDGWSITVTTDATAATTFSNNTPIQGGDGARGRSTPYNSSITASGLTGAVTDINITLNSVNHLNPDDLDIMLIGPSGKRIILMSDAGGTTDLVGVNITFDDSASATVADAGPITSGAFKPTNFGTGDTFPDYPAPYPNPGTAGTATLASVFNGTDANGVWQLVITDDATTSAGDITGGWTIDITAGGTYGAKRFTSADFDGDGKTDFGVYRSFNVSTGFWYLRDNKSLNDRYLAFGSAGNDLPAPADYDGDRIHDIAVARIGGAFGSPMNWYIINSSTNTLSTIPFGTVSDTPVPQDYDGDGRYDLAVYRSGTWYIRNSNNGGTPTFRSIRWGGATGDLAIRGHFTGNNGADVAIYRPTEATWYIAPNPQGGGNYAVQFGVSSGDLPVPGDYDGDGKTDIAVFRQSEGNWYIYFSGNATTLARQWGAVGDRLIPGDYDGDSITDIAVWRTGTSYILNSGTLPGAAAVRIDSYGLGSDTPLGSLYYRGLPN